LIADDKKKQYLSSESPGGMPELTGGTKLKSKKTPVIWILSPKKQNEG
jgi:hypothetical protein